MRAIDLIVRVWGIRDLCHSMQELSATVHVVARYAPCRSRPSSCSWPRLANRIWRSGLKTPDACQARENSTAPLRGLRGHYAQDRYARLLYHCDNISAVMLTSSVLWSLTTHNEVKLDLGTWTGHAELREPPRGGPWRSPKRAIRHPKWARLKLKAAVVPVLRRCLRACLQTAPR